MAERSNPGREDRDSGVGARGATIDVVGFGESSVDLVHVVPELPRPGVSKIRVSSHDITCGGQVATTMAGCAALGLKASYLGAIGDDENGRRVQKELRGRGVDVSRIVVRNAATRSAVILVDEGSADRMVLWRRDERLNLAPSEITLDLVAGARAVHVDGTDEAASIGLARLAASAGAIVTCDVDTVTDRTRELVAAATVPVLAEPVPQALTGARSVEAALRVLRQAHDGLLVVTLGERGAVALEGNRFVEASAFPVHAVDTTGAGDVFRAGLLYGLLQRWPVERLLRFANAAAALSCTRQGAINGVPSLDEVLAITCAA